MEDEGTGVGSSGEECLGSVVKGQRCEQGVLVFVQLL